MRYLGSKRRIAKEILPLILADRKPDQWYVEPFVGGCNSIDKVDGPRIGADANGWLISMWGAVQKGWIPPVDVSLRLYTDMRILARESHWDDVDLETAALVGFLGTGGSFGGKWFAGYSRGKTNDGRDRNFFDESRRAIARQKPRLSSVVFSTRDYKGLEIPPESVIYCDPPYSGTTGYGSDWNTAEFWDWCEKKTEEGHTLFVSEYTAPTGWQAIWEKQQTTTVNARSGYKTDTEKLWRKT